MPNTQAKTLEEIIGDLAGLAKHADWSEIEPQEVEAVIADLRAYAKPDAAPAMT